MAKSKPSPNGKADFTATFGFGGTAQRFSACSKSEATLRNLCNTTDYLKLIPRAIPPMSALRASAFPNTEGTPKVASAARDNNANFAWVHHFTHYLASQGMAGFVLANASMCSNQSCEGTTRNASSKPEANPHGLARRRDIRKALIKIYLMDSTQFKNQVTLVS